MSVSLFHTIQVEYHTYSDELWARMGQHAAEYGNKSAVDKFSKEAGHRISKSTVWGCNTLYQAKLKELKDPSKVTALPHGNEGHPI